MSIRSPWVLVLIAFVGLFSFSSSLKADVSSDPCVIKVKAGESIQSAVNLAETNAANGVQCAVWVGEGTFNESVTIGNNQTHLKNLILSGAGIGKTIMLGKILIQFFQTSGEAVDGGVTTIKNLTLDGQKTTGYGVHAVGGYTRAESLYVKNYKYGGVYVQLHGRLELSRSIITGNRDGVISGTDLEKILLVNNTIVRNERGVSQIYVTGGRPSGRLINNIIAENIRGVHTGIYGTLVAEYNAFYQNGTDYTTAPNSGLETNLFGIDPLFVNPDAGDFHLNSASPMKNAGDPTSPRDPDGTVADIGAYSLHRTPSLLGAASVKIHRSVSRELGIPIDGALFVEPRLNGVEQIVLTFDENVETSDISVTPSTGSIAGKVASGNQLTLSFNTFASGKRLDLAINGIANENKVLHVANLYGNVVQSGAVDLGDAVGTMQYVNRSMTSQATRADVNLDNAVTTLDLKLVLSNRGKTLES